jgi:hypothetical protein
VRDERLVALFDDGVCRLGGGADGPSTSTAAFATGSPSGPLIVPFTAPPPARTAVATMSERTRRSPRALMGSPSRPAAGGWYVTSTAVARPASTWSGCSTVPSTSCHTRSV